MRRRTEKNERRIILAFIGMVLGSMGVLASLITLIAKKEGSEILAAFFAAILVVSTSTISICPTKGTTKYASKKVWRL